MFYYYGRKKQIAKHYPSPNFDTIIEPFAGSAAYSLYSNNWRKQVVLIEKDSKVCQVWEWLINEATPSKVAALPDLKVGEKSSEFLHIVHAASKQAFKYKTIKVTPILARNWEISRRVFAENLHKVKHWKIHCNDYQFAPDITATWFIDPPYKDEQGMGYHHSSAAINYRELADWARMRKGEVIFCEGKSGEYLPFEPLIELKGVAGKTSSEKMFYQSALGYQQGRLF